MVNDGTSDLTPVLEPGSVSAYTLTVGGEVSQVTVKPTTTHSAAVVSYSHTTDVDGDPANGLQVDLTASETLIRFQVDAEDGTTAIYVITVTRLFACTAPVIPDERVEVWTGTMTVGTNSGGTNHGFSTAAGILANDYGSLDPVGFEFGGNDYVIQSIIEYGASGTVDYLTFDLDRNVPTADRTGLHLHICSDAFDTGDAVYVPNGRNFAWQGNAVVDWSGATTVELALSRAKSSDAALSDLAVNDGDGNTVTLDPATFDPNTTEYSATVPNAVGEVTVTPTRNDENAAIAYSDTTDADGNAANGHQVSLAEGDTTITVTVTAEDGNATESYTVTVTREEAFVCAAPDLAGRTEIWSATMTVGVGAEFCQ